MTTKYKTIRVSAETYENLVKKGTIRDSFDDVIGRLLILRPQDTQEDER